MWRCKNLLYFPRDVRSHFGVCGSTGRPDHHRRADGNQECNGGGFFAAFFCHDLRLKRGLQDGSRFESLLTGAEARFVRARGFV